MLDANIPTCLHKYAVRPSSIPTPPPPAAPVPPSSSQFAVPQVPPTGGQVPPPLAAEAVSPGRHNIFIN